MIVDDRRVIVCITVLRALDVDQRLLDRWALLTSTTDLRREMVIQRLPYVLKILT